MTITQPARPIDGAKLDATATIDACLFHDWPSTLALAPYLDAGWREVMIRDGDLGGPLSLRAEWLYSDPRGAARDDAYPDAGPAASSVELTLEQAVEGHSYGVLGYREGLLATGLNHYAMARAVTQAANRWTIDEWLAADARLRALVLVCNAVPHGAAADIREFGAHSGMVGVAMGANGLGRAFGHACYHEIYEAAAEMNLPVVIQAGSDAVSSLDASPTAGGLPATYAEYMTHAAHTLMAHVASLIVEGVFERFPSLKVLCVGGGAAWLPAYSWRMDYWFKMNSHEMPWLKRLPSEYLATNIRIATGSLERPRNPRELDALWQSWPDFASMLVYTSEYPTRDGETAGAVASRIPPTWHQQVFLENARELFSLQEV